MSVVVDIPAAVEKYQMSAASSAYTVIVPSPFATPETAVVEAVEVVWPICSVTLSSPSPKSTA